jgi:hypothetical protein
VFWLKGGTTKAILRQIELNHWGWRTKACATADMRSVVLKLGEIMGSIDACETHPAVGFALSYRLALL